eukprot:jgi/Mesvir1/27525/Mv07286-RA.1
MASKARTGRRASSTDMSGSPEGEVPQTPLRAQHFQLTPANVATPSPAKAGKHLPPQSPASVRRKKKKSSASRQNVPPYIAPDGKENEQAGASAKKLHRSVSEPQGKQAPPQATDTAGSRLPPQPHDAAGNIVLGYYLHSSHMPGDLTGPRGQAPASSHGLDTEDWSFSADAAASTRPPFQSVSPQALSAHMVGGVPSTPLNVPPSPNTSISSASAFGATPSRLTDKVQRMRSRLFAEGRSSGKVSGELRRLYQSAAENGHLREMIENIKQKELDLAFHEFEDEMRRWEALAEERDEALARKDEELARKDDELALKVEELAKKEEELAWKDDELANKDEDLARQEEEIALKGEELARRDAELAWKGDEVARKVEEIAHKVEEIARKDDELGQKDAELLLKDEELALKDEELAQKDEELGRQAEEIALKDAALAEKDALLARLEQAVAELGAQSEVLSHNNHGLLLENQGLHSHVALLMGMLAAALARRDESAVQATALEGPTATLAAPDGLAMPAAVATNRHAPTTAAMEHSATSNTGIEASSPSTAAAITSMATASAASCHFSASPSFGAPPLTSPPLDSLRPSCNSPPLPSSASSSPPLDSPPLDLRDEVLLSRMDLGVCGCDGGKRESCGSTTGQGNHRDPALASRPGNHQGELASKKGKQFGELVTDARVHDASASPSPNNSGGPSIGGPDNLTGATICLIASTSGPDTSPPLAPTTSQLSSLSVADGRQDYGMASYAWGLSPVVPSSATHAALGGSPGYSGSGTTAASPAQEGGWGASEKAQASLGQLGQMYPRGYSSSPIDLESSPIDRESSPMDHSSSPIDRESSPIDRESSPMDPEMGDRSPVEGDGGDVCEAQPRGMLAYVPACLSPTLALSLPLSAHLPSTSTASCNGPLAHVPASPPPLPATGDHHRGPDGPAVAMAVQALSMQALSMQALGDPSLLEPFPVGDDLLDRSYADDSWLLSSGWGAAGASGKTPARGAAAVGDQASGSSPASMLFIMPSANKASVRHPAQDSSTGSVSGAVAIPGTTNTPNDAATSGRPAVAVEGAARLAALRSMDDDAHACCPHERHMAALQARVQEYEDQLASTTHQMAVWRDRAGDRAELEEVILAHEARALASRHELAAALVNKDELDSLRRQVEESAEELASAREEGSLLRHRLEELKSQVTLLQDPAAKVASLEERADMAKDLRSRVLDLEQQVKGLEAHEDEGQLARLREASAAQCGALEESVLDRRSLLEEKQRRVAELEEALEHRETRVAELEEALEHRETCVVELEAARKHREARLAELEGLVAAGRDQVASLARQVAGYERQVSESEAQLALLTKTRERLLQERAAETASLEGWTEEASRLQARVLELELQVEDVEGRDYEGQLARVREASDTAAACLQARVLELEQQLLALESEQEVSEGQVRAALEGQLVAARAEVAAARKELASLEGLMTESTAVAAGLREKLGASDRHVAELERQVSRYEDQVAWLEERASMTVVLEGELASTAAALAVAKQRLVALEGELSSSAASLVDSKQRLVAMEGELEASTQRFAAVMGELATSAATLLASKQQLMAVESELGDSKQRVTALESEVASMTTAMAASRVHVAMLEGELASTTVALEIATKQAVTLEEANASLKLTLAARTQQLAALEGVASGSVAVVAARRETLSLEEQLAAREAQLASAREEGASLRRQVQERAQELMSARDNEALLRQRLEELKSQMASLQDRVAEVASLEALGSLREEKEVLQWQVQALERELASAREGKAAVEATLEEREREHENAAASFMDQLAPLRAQVAAYETHQCGDSPSPSPSTRLCCFSIRGGAHRSEEAECKGGGEEAPVSEDGGASPAQCDALDWGDSPGATVAEATTVLEPQQEVERLKAHVGSLEAHIASLKSQLAEQARAPQFSVLQGTLASERFRWEECASRVAKEVLASSEKASPSAGEAVSQFAGEVSMSEQRAVQLAREVSALEERASRLAEEASGWEERASWLARTLEEREGELATSRESVARLEEACAHLQERVRLGQLQEAGAGASMASQGSHLMVDAVTSTDDDGGGGALPPSRPGQEIAATLDRERSADDGSQGVAVGSDGGDATQSLCANEAVLGPSPSPAVAVAESSDSQPRPAGPLFVELERTSPIPRGEAPARSLEPSALLASSALAEPSALMADLIEQLASATGAARRATWERDELVREAEVVREELERMGAEVGRLRGLLKQQQARVDALSRDNDVLGREKEEAVRGREEAEAAAERAERDADASDERWARLCAARAEAEGMPEVMGREMAAADRVVEGEERMHHLTTGEELVGDGPLSISLATVASGAECELAGAGRVASEAWHEAGAGAAGGMDGDRWLVASRAAAPMTAPAAEAAAMTTAPAATERAAMTAATTSVAATATTTAAASGDKGIDGVVPQDGDEAGDDAMGAEEPEPRGSRYSSFLAGLPELRAVLGQAGASSYMPSSSLAAPARLKPSSSMMEESAASGMAESAASNGLALGLGYGGVRTLTMVSRVRSAAADQTGQSLSHAEGATVTQERHTKPPCVDIGVGTSDEGVLLGCAVKDSSKMGGEGEGEDQGASGDVGRRSGVRPIGCEEPIGPQRLLWSRILSPSGAEGTSRSGTERGYNGLGVRPPCSQGPAAGSPSTTSLFGTKGMNDGLVALVAPLWHVLEEARRDADALAGLHERTSRVLEDALLASVTVHSDGGLTGADRLGLIEVADRPVSINGADRLDSMEAVWKQEVEEGREQRVAERRALEEEVQAMLLRLQAEEAWPSGLLPQRSWQDPHREMGSLLENPQAGSHTQAGVAMAWQGTHRQVEGERQRPLLTSREGMPGDGREAQEAGPAPAPAAAIATPALSTGAVTAADLFSAVRATGAVPALEASDGSQLPLWPDLAHLMLASIEHAYRDNGRLREALEESRRQVADRERRLADKEKQLVDREELAGRLQGGRDLAQELKDALLRETAEAQQRRALQSRLKKVVKLLRKMQKDDPDCALCSKASKVAEALLHSEQA